MRCASTQEPPPPTGGDLVSLLPLRWLRYGQPAAAGETADLVRSNPEAPKSAAGGRGHDPSPDSHRR